MGRGCKPPSVPFISTCEAEAIQQGRRVTLFVERRRFGSNLFDPEWFRRALGLPHARLI
jgi:hypothetical protein